VDVGLKLIVCIEIDVLWLGLLFLAFVSNWRLVFLVWLGTSVESSSGTIIAIVGIPVTRAGIWIDLVRFSESFRHLKRLLALIRFASQEHQPLPISSELLEQSSSVLDSSTTTVHQLLLVNRHVRQQDIVISDKSGLISNLLKSIDSPIPPSKSHSFKLSNFTSPQAVFSKSLIQWSFVPSHEVASEDLLNLDGAVSDVAVEHKLFLLFQFFVAEFHNFHHLKSMRTLSFGRKSGPVVQWIIFD